MLAFCTRCWSEMTARDVVCPHCGARVDDDPRPFEQKLVAALNHPLPETRARICWVLGAKRAEWAVPNLIEMLRDSDLFVRIAALQALAEIGGPLVQPALEQAANSENALMRRLGRGALERTRKQLV